MGTGLLEGVMFGGREHTVSHRRNDQSIDYYYAKKNITVLSKLKDSFPTRKYCDYRICRSVQTLTIFQRSIRCRSGEEEENGEELSKLQIILGVAAVGVISFLFGKFVFTLVPVFLAELFAVDFGKYPQIFLETGFKLIYSSSIYIYR